MEDRLDVDPSSLHFVKELNRSTSSSIFEVELAGDSYALKVFHDNGDEGFSKKGRDLNRFRCELNSYRNLHSSGVCDAGLVPHYYGYIDGLDPAKFQPHLSHFTNDNFPPRAILLEFPPDTEELNCVNYSDDHLRAAVHELSEIHRALVHHHDIYPKNILIVRGGGNHDGPERVVWIDFDVAMTFSSASPTAEEYCKYEIELVESFGELLKEDQREGLPPNTKFY